MQTVTKIIKFDYAHRLMGEDGELYDKNKCGSIHGHTGKLEITVIRKYGDPDNFQFVMDFSDFKDIKDWINKHIDHALVVSYNDGTLLEFCDKEEMKYFRMPERYSCANSENMLKVFEPIFTNLLPYYVEIVEMKFYETPTSYATWRKYDME